MPRWLTVFGRVNHLGAEPGMIEKDVNVLIFFILRVETAWPTWKALCRNVRLSVHYIINRTWRRSEQTETVVGSGAIAVMRKIDIVSVFWPSL